MASQGFLNHISATSLRSNSLMRASFKTCISQLTDRVSPLKNIRPMALRRAPIDVSLSTSRNSAYSLSATPPSVGEETLSGTAPPSAPSMSVGCPCSAWARSFVNVLNHLSHRLHSNRDPTLVNPGLGTFPRSHSC